MFDPLVEGGYPPVAASLHSFTIAEGFRQEPDAAELHNGMAWSAGEELFYVAHSQAQSIYTFAYSPAGRIAGRWLFAAIPAELGLLDGAAIDIEGGYWCALHGAGRLRRFRADGTVDYEIVLTVSQPTMCAFGGGDLEVLYVTSATDKFRAASRQREPHAGALLSLRPGERGIPRSFIVR